MKTREILIIGLFIIAVCVVSLIPFSNSTLEGVETITGNATVEGDTITGNATVEGDTITGNATTPPANNFIFNSIITTNIEFINATISILNQPINQQNDKVSIYNIQGLISPFNTQNSATLLSEMANPNNLTDPRLFIQYMNWFASHCPLDSNTCTGLC